MALSSCMRIRGLLWIHVLVVCCFFVFISDAKAENRALLIGVGEYEMGLKLPGIKNDILNMQKAVSLMGVEPHQVKVLLNEQATLDNIRQAVEVWLVKGVTSEDRVIFYFSGHGSQIKDISGDEADGADEVLLPYNAVLQDNTLDHVLVDEEFDQILNKIPADIVLVFLDACHSGTATRRVFNNPDGYVPKFYNYKGMPVITPGPANAEETRPGNYGKYIALSACRDDEEALSSGEGSLLTQGILSALDEAALLGSGLTMNAFKVKTTGFIAKRLALSNRTQHPQITGNNSLADAYIINSQIKNLWTGLEALAVDPGYQLQIDVPKKLRINDILSISCSPGRSGYLNMIMIDSNAQEAMVLYPNRLNPDNRVHRNTVVTVPGEKAPFFLRAQSPPGKSMVLAFHTSEKIDFFADGVGDGADYFRKLSGKSLKDILQIKTTQPSEFGAQAVTIETTEK